MKDKAEQLLDDIINAHTKQGHYADGNSVGLILQSFEKVCREAFKEGGKFADYCTVLGADGNLDIASEDYWKSLTENKQQ